MKYDDRYSVRIPYKEYSTHACDVKATFKEIVQELHTRMPYLNLEYAYVNTSDPMERIQMMLLYSFTAKNGTGTIKKYLIYIANTFSYFSFEGYDIVKKRGYKDDWFKDFIEKPIVYPEVFFKDIINRSDELCWDKTKSEEKWWKNPKNGQALAKHLDEYATTYESTAPTR